MNRTIIVLQSPCIKRYGGINNNIYIYIEKIVQGYGAFANANKEHATNGLRRGDGV